MKLRENKSQLLVSPKIINNSDTINQNSYFSIVKLDNGKEIACQKYSQKNGLFIININGKFKIYDEIFDKKDAIGIEEVDEILFKFECISEILIIEFQ